MRGRQKPNHNIQSLFFKGEPDPDLESHSNGAQSIHFTDSDLRELPKTNSVKSTCFTGSDLANVGGKLSGTPKGGAKNRPFTQGSIKCIANEMH